MKALQDIPTVKYGSFSFSNLANEIVATFTKLFCVISLLPLVQRLK